MLCTELELLVIVLEIIEEVWLLVLSPVVLMLSDAIHEKVELTFAVGARLNADPLQILEEVALVI